MNLMMTLSLFSALAIGRIPAYLLAKAKQTDRKGQGEIHNFKTLISIPAWTRKPSWVAVATKDRTINPDLEWWYATRTHSHKIEVVGASHSVYTSRPKEVAALIEDAATHAR
jgi:pimeloyl-ACP methyl ester carboxylesterase